MQLKKYPIIAVIGSGKRANRQLCEETGKLISKFTVHLVTGGGQGVMSCVAEGFCSSASRKGMSIGIIPSDENRDFDNQSGYPNEFVEIAILTHLSKSGKEGISSQSRNHIIVKTARCIVALPGGFGTESEKELSKKYEKPLIEINSIQDMEKLTRWLESQLNFTIYPAMP
jgi:uncharacterized protein (TIGR00725 family)